MSIKTDDGSVLLQTPERRGSFLSNKQFSDSPNSRMSPKLVHAGLKIFTNFVTPGLVPTVKESPKESKEERKKKRMSGRDDRKVTGLKLSESSPIPRRRSATIAYESPRK